MRKEFLTLGAALAAASLVVPATAVAATSSDRLAGSDRYETAIQIAASFEKPDTVYLARGDNQADAVAGGKLPGGPLLLVNESSKVRDEVAAMIKKLGAKNVVVLGGTSAVSDATVKAVSGDLKVARVAGMSRFDTAAEISKVLTKEKTVAKVYLANGFTLVDALVGGTLTDDAPILLTNGSGVLPSATVDEIKRLKPTEIVALGGAKAVKAEELNAAASVNGAGGGLSAEAAVKKVTADLEKEVRLAEMQVKGFYTVTSGYTVDEFLKTGCTTLAKDAKDTDKAEAKKALEITFPRVLPREVVENCSEQIFKVDGLTRAGSKADADAAAAKLAKTDSSGVATFMGLEKAADKATASSKVKETAEAAEKAKEKVDKAKKDYDDASAAHKEKPDSATKKKVEETEKAFDEAKKELEKADKAAADAKASNENVLDKATALALARANSAFKEAKDALDNIKDSKATHSDKVKQLLQAAMGAGGAKTSRLSGADRYQTALEIAKTAYPSGGNAKAIYVANGDASADATVAGFIDNDKDRLAGPVLLVRNDSVPAEVESYLKATRQANPKLEAKFKALGGTAVVSDTVVDVVKALLR